jgi:hypothetical protein
VISFLVTLIFQILRILSDSVCEADGQLMPGDMLVSLNDENLANVPHSTALQILKEPNEQSTIVVLREDTIEQQGKEPGISNVSVVQIHKPRPEPPPKPPRKEESHIVKNYSEQRIQNNRSIGADHFTNNHTRSDKEQRLQPLDLDLQHDSSLELPQFPSEQTSYQSVPDISFFLEEEEPEKEPLLVPVPTLPASREETVNEPLLSPNLSELNEEESRSRMKELQPLMSDLQTRQEDKSNNNDNNITIVPETVRKLQSKNVSPKSAVVVMDTINVCDAENEQPDKSVVAMEMTELKTAENSQLSRPLVGRRHETRPFVITFEKKYRSFGVGAGLDNKGRLVVAEVSSFGLVGKDGNIRYD